MEKRIAVSELLSEEFENPKLKNELFRGAEEEWIAIVDQEKTKWKELKKHFEEERLAENTVIVFCEGVSSEMFEIELEDLLENADLSIIGLVFSRKLLRTSGYYNEQFASATNMELLCRLTETVGHCTACFLETNEALEIGNRETDAPVYAYLVRRYYQRLHLGGRLEAVFQRMCEVLEQGGGFSLFQEQLNQLLSDEASYESIAADTAPFVILCGDHTCFGVLRDFALRLSEALKAIGQAAILVQPGVTDYEWLRRQVCKGIVGFQASALTGEYFGNLHGPKFQFWTDNPIFYSEYFRGMPKDHFVLCQDENYAEFIRKHYGGEHALQLPPGGIDSGEAREEERPYDLIFIGKYLREEESMLEGKEKEFYEYMLAHPQETFEQGLSSLPAQKNGAFDEEELTEKLVEWKHTCQRVMDHYRKEVIETILRAGYSVHVYGESWKEYQSENRDGLNLHPEVSVEESLKEWRKAKIGLNLMSWHKAGMTERIANIMLSGAVCLSEESEYLRQHTKDGEEIMLYSLSELEKLPGMIADLLQNEEKRKRIAERAYEKARAEFTWEVRAGQLAELAENWWIECKKQKK